MNVKPLKTSWEKKMALKLEKEQMLAHRAELVKLNEEERAVSEIFEKEKI